GQQQSLFGGLLSKTDLYVGAEGAVDTPLLAASNVAEPQAPSPAEKGMGYTSAPQGAIAPANDQRPATSDYGVGIVDRSLSANGHAADALKGIVALGDAPSCHVCGAIMTRNGSCYRCMECGSTSGCS